MKQQVFGARLPLAKVTLAKLTSLALLSGLVLALGGCSGASNNFTSSGGSSGAGSRIACQSDCVQAEVTLTPVENLNYSCGTANNVTKVDSLISCTAGSTMSLFIQAVDGARKIELGNTLIQKKSNNDAGNTNNFLLRLTPVDLVGAEGATDINDRKLTSAVNIIRFLDAFNIKTEVKDGKNIYKTVSYNDYAPVNQLLIPESYKNTMDEYMTEDVTLADFQNDNFINKTKNWLAHHDLAVTLGPADAKKRLEQLLNTSMSGVYYQGQALLVGRSLAGGIAGKSKGSSEYDTMLSIYTLANRDNQTIGQGMRWSMENYNDNDERIFIALPNQTLFSKMHFANGAKPNVSPFNKRLTDYRWQYTNTKGDAQEVDFYQGKLIRDFVVVSSQDEYSRYTGTTTTDTSVFGRWREVGSDGAQNVAGEATIFKQPTQSASTYLDPDVWRSEHVVDVGKRYVFPLYLTLDFRYGAGSSACGSSGCAFTNGGSLGVVILENGNIVTDAGGAADDKYTLGTKPDCKPDGDAAIPVGIVRSTSRTYGSGQTGAILNYGMMLSGEAFGELDGVQVGTRTLSNLIATINVQGLIDDAGKNLAQSSKVVANDVVTTDGKASLQPPSWSNLYNQYKSIYIRGREAADKDLDPSISQAQADDIKLKRAGRLTVKTSDCYGLAERER